MPRRGLRDRLLPWSGTPDEPAPGPLRVGPYLPPYRTGSEPDPFSDEQTTRFAGRVAEPPPRWPPDGPSDEWRWVDQALGVPRATVHGGPVRRRLAIVALVTAVAILAGALAVLGTRPGARKNAAPPAGTGATASPAPTFAPITMEAEAQSASLTGSAQVSGYPGASGGKVVRYIGNWGRPGGPGAVRFNGIVVPATGSYLLTVSYVNANANDTTRSVVITASGPASAVAVLAGGTTCCATQLVQVHLVKGSNSITLSQPRGHAPTIDKITIGPPH